MFWLFIMLLAAQRIAEMIVARRNEQKVKKQGAVEYGEGHYPFLVLMHVLFFVSLTAEVAAFQKRFLQGGPPLYVLFYLYRGSGIGRYYH